MVEKSWIKGFDRVHRLLSQKEEVYEIFLLAQSTGWLR
jgi:hypothetical protein